jgi:hypothetical protein
MIHEIINPSDPYTIECDDMALLTASVFVLGEGSYSTRSSDTDYEVPMTIFGGKDGASYFRDTFGFDLSKYVGEYKLEIAECLESVCLGSANDRILFMSARDKIDDEAKREEFVKEWFDKNQSSMNQIGQRY